MAQEKKLEIDLDITPDVARGVYSNLVVMSHSMTEVVLDFAQVLPGQQKAFVRERVIMSPLHAKRLLMALEDNIDKYEEAFGEIEDPQNRAAIPIDLNTLGKA